MQVLVGDVALEDPALHADDAVGRLRFGEAIVDVRAQGVQRHASLAVPLAPTHLGPAETAGALDPDSPGAELHGRRDGLLHRPAERDAALELQRHVLGHELRVQLGLPDLLDVDEDLLVVRKLRELGAQRLHFGAAFADHDSRSRRVDVHDDLVPAPVDDDLGDSRVEQLLLDEVPDLDVLVELLPIPALREPVGLPPVEGAEPESVGMYLLSHERLRSLLVEDDFDVARPVLDPRLARP